MLEAKQPGLLENPESPAERGKRTQADHEGRERAVPIRLETRRSLIDGSPCVAVLYPGSSPWPLSRLVDELRLLDDEVLLGMTMLTPFGLQRFPFPFILSEKPGF